MVLSKQYKNESREIMVCPRPINYIYNFDLCLFSCFYSTVYGTQFTSTKNKNASFFASLVTWPKIGVSLVFGLLSTASHKLPGINNDSKRITIYQFMCSPEVFRSGQANLPQNTVRVNKVHPYPFRYRLKYIFASISSFQVVSY